MPAVSSLAEKLPIVCHLIFPVTHHHRPCISVFLTRCFLTGLSTPAVAIACATLLCTTAHHLSCGQDAPLHGGNKQLQLNRNLERRPFRIRFGEARVAVIKENSDVDDEVLVVSRATKGEGSEGDDKIGVGGGGLTRPDLFPDMGSYLRLARPTAF
ncbi:hypothetical protein TREMEDRAFT_66520 [Tremella mesenterica DSM 1558]|uniref:uncharacterized protein n=1 Tax=Tremella mesenterica (strain ATCC 24925 / CBS 8224 / DSM 1558 / NBRC 9311 / NRRL Y-6157 / RJB 2259-6 / UBC 559-6) TaxID=578456 RepID=UPI00032D5CA9|nr:uncharacterized protein TREMEDRAFT_66520 [Tremella mesenterica DSM 1558]EIW65458.1 hypothetical protein TREMEDRAFT_66520 [Tremella mesenterica DSM 1558]